MKKFVFQVTAVLTFTDNCTIFAEDEKQARIDLLDELDEHPLDQRRNTFEHTDLEVVKLDESVVAPAVHTIEALFDADEETDSRQVILIKDLTQEQLIYLGLCGPDENNY